MNTSKSLDEALANFQHRTIYYQTMPEYEHKWTVRTAEQGDEGLLCSCGFHVRQEWLDEAKQAIVEAVEGLINREPESYRKYLVVRHKLGLEENQAQAKLIATVLDNYKAELLQAIKEWQ